MCTVAIKLSFGIVSELQKLVGMQYLNERAFSLCDQKVASHGNLRTRQ